MPRKPLLQTPAAITARARWARYRAEGRCQCGRQKISPDRSQCQTCYDSTHKWRDKIRLEVLTAYGSKCQCPGGCDVSESKFLSLDHINNDGHKHRRTLYSGKTMGDPLRVYLDVKRRGFPKDEYRLLCHNCNQARAFYGECPHASPTE